jgi:multiple sugar transport system ATP-binding protein
VKVGDAVTIGIRPEHLILTANGPLMVQVASTEVLGAETVLHGKTAGGEAVTATMRGILATQRGDTLRFDIADAFTHVVDANGRTLQPTRAGTDDYMKRTA